MVKNFYTSLSWLKNAKKHEKSSHVKIKYKVLSIKLRNHYILYNDPW